MPLGKSRQKKSTSGDSRVDRGPLPQYPGNYEASGCQDGEKFSWALGGWGEDHLLIQLSKEESFEESGTGVSLNDIFGAAAHFSVQVMGQSCRS